MVTVAQLVAKIAVEGDVDAINRIKATGDVATSTGNIFKNALGTGLSLASNLAAKGLGILKDQLVDSVRVAMKHQDVVAQTVQVLKSTHDISGMTAASIDNLATSLSHVTKFSKDSIESGENLMLTFTGIGKKVFPDATQAMLDLSQATGQSLKSSAIQLGKALNDPLKGLTALSRVGVSFSQQEKDQIKTMMAHNDTIGAQRVMLKELESEFGGSATAAGKTFSGQLQILKNNFDDLKEKIATAILPILSRFMDFVSTNISPALSTMADILGKNVSPAIHQVATFLHSLADNWSELQDAINLPAIKKAWDDLLPRFTGGQNILQKLGIIINNVSNFVERLAISLAPLLPPLIKIGGQVGSGVANVFGRIVNNVQLLLPKINNLVDALRPFVQKILDFVAKHDLVKIAFNALADAIDRIFKVLGKVVDDFAKFLNFLTSSTTPAQVLRDALMGVAAAFIAIKTANIVSTFGSFLAMLPDLIGLVGLLATGMGALAVEVVIATWPFIVAGIVIAAVVAGIILAVQHWGEISKWLQDRWKDVTKFFGEVGHNIQQFFAPIGKWFQDRFEEARKNIVAVFAPIGKWFQDKWNEITGPLKAVSNYMGDVFQTIWNIITAIFIRIGKWFADRWADITKVFAITGKWFQDRFTEAWRAIVTVFTPIGKWFADRWNDLTRVFTPIGKWFRDRFTEAWQNIVTIFTPIGKWFQDRWNDVINGVLKFKDSVIAKFNEIKDSVTAVFHNIINGIVDKLNDGISAVESFINFFGQGLDNIAKALGTQGTIPVAHLPRIPHYATGTDGHPGGPAIVGEKGRELVFLPKGTSVVPNNITEMLLAMMHGGIPGYAGGVGDIANNILGWVGGGAQSLLNNVLNMLHIKAPNLGPMASIALGIMNKIKDWAVGWIAKLLPHFDFGGGSGGGTGGTPIPGNLQSWIAAAMALTGTPGNWAGPLAVIAMHESGGNPNAQNNWDINAQNGDPSRGLFQTIGATFRAYMLPGHGNIFNPVDNAIAAIRYIIARYGSVFNVPGIVSMGHGGGYVGYANGTDSAMGGWSWIGEKGKELMYIPRGARIYSHDQSNAMTQPQIIVNPAPVYLDGRILTNGLMPYIANAIRANVGTHRY